MPLQNRVTPAGEIIATPARGQFMGNRGGPIHGPGRVLTKRRWASKAWITCRLSFRGRHREIMSPRSYTELFFLDEATSLAAGHRPCAECRRADFNRFMRLWAAADGQVPRAYVAEVDPVLHAERVGPDRSKRTHRASLAELPDGIFVLMAGDSYLVCGDALLPWSPAGYGRPAARPAAVIVDVLTPASIVTVIRRGYRPHIHPGECLS